MEAALAKFAYNAIKQAVKKGATKGATDAASQLKFSKHANINVPKVEGESLKFINQKPRKTSAANLLGKQDIEDFKAYGRKYAQENINPKTGKGTLANSMKINVRKPDGDVEKLGLKFKSDRYVGIQPESVKTRQGDKRVRMETEQTYGPNAYREGGGHHRGELSFFDALTEGLSEGKKKAFFKLVNTSQRWPSMSTGNVASNLIGPGGDLNPKVHAIIHRLLEEAGLDPKKMDFRNASIKERSDFLDQAEPIINKIDEFIYNERMAERFPDRFKSMIK
jgi:hypothetical protein